MQKVKTRLKNEYQEFKLLLRAIPSLLLVCFVLSVFVMNLLANKSINLNVNWLALDAGFIVSWICFLAMDMISQYFGLKAANEITVLGIIVNLIICLIFYIGSIIPGTWGESYVEGSEAVINQALDNTFAGTWYVILGSMVAFLVSSVIDNSINYLLGKAFKKNPNSLLAYITRSYVSTMIGQFIDNLLFAFIVSYVFFGWSPLQCVTCSLTGMVLELLCEAIFSFFGFKVVKKWKNEEIGKDYFEFRQSLITEKAI